MDYTTFTVQYTILILLWSSSLWTFQRPRLSCSSWLFFSLFSNRFFFPWPLKDPRRVCEWDLSKFGGVRGHPIKPFFLHFLHRALLEPVRYTNHSLLSLPNTSRIHGFHFMSSHFHMDMIWFFCQYHQYHELVNYRLQYTQSRHLFYIVCLCTPCTLCQAVMEYIWSLLRKVNSALVLITTPGGISVLEGVLVQFPPGRSSPT